MFRHFVSDFRQNFTQLQTQFFLSLIQIINYNSHLHKRRCNLFTIQLKLQERKLRVSSVRIFMAFLVRLWSFVSPFLQLENFYDVKSRERLCLKSVRLWSFSQNKSLKQDKCKQVVASTITHYQNPPIIIFAKLAPKVSRFTWQRLFRLGDRDKVEVW